MILFCQMKKLNIINQIIIALILLSLGACSDDEPVLDDEPDSKFPSDFTISVTDLGINHATINWTESIDPSGSEITYDLYFNGAFITRKTQELSYHFEDLVENRRYEVEVFATNDLGLRTKSILGFRTKMNEPPTEFEILEAKNSSEEPMNVVLKWEEAIDPEGSEVTYNVFISDRVVTNGRIRETEFTLEFRPEKTINGYIEAYDGQLNSTRVNFSFENDFPTIEDDITLTSQQEVDDFGEHGYKIILGSLDIHESTGGSITDLSPLSSLVQMTKGLRIYGNSNLSDLNGLEGLTNNFFDPEEGLYTNMYIANNPMLQNIEGLSNLRNVTKLQIINNGLKNLSGLEGLSYFKGIEIIGNNFLENINDLLTQNGSIVEGIIKIENNQALRQINGFNNVEVIKVDREESGIVVNNNNSLESINAFASEIPFDGIIHITNNNKLLSIEGFQNIVSVEGYYDIADTKNSTIRIENNTNLVSVVGFSGNNLRSFLSLSNNDALEHIDDAFLGLTYGDFVIKENAKLQSVNGLKDLITGYHYILIAYNPMLTSLEGLQNFTNIDFDDEFNSGIAQFTIVGNNSLETLNGLSNCLRYSSLAILDNESLTDFCAIKPNAYFELCCGDDEYVGLGGNAFNPSEQDLREGNCSQ